MERFKLVVALALTGWFAVPGRAADMRMVRRDLDRYMLRITERGFSGTVLVARDGKVILAQGYGSLGAQSGKVEVDSVFDIASVTKQLTAATVLKLEMQGKIRTTDRISKYLSGVPTDKDGITIHHLLTHTSGLPDNIGGDYDVAPRDETVLKILSAALDSNPGTRYSYSNAGYSLLAALVEHVSAMTWEQYAQTFLFRPAKMEDTGYKLPKWERGRVAESFLRVKYPSPLDRPGPYWNLLGNGGVLSTVEDLYRWHRALTKSDVLSGSAKKKLFMPYVLEAPGGSTSYGYGWVIQRTDRKTTLAWHNGGAEEGFTSYFGRYLDEDAVIILLSNAVLSGGVQPILFAPSALENILFGSPYAIPPAPVPRPATELNRSKGTYKLPSGGRFLVSVKEDGLSIQADGRDAVGILTYPQADRSPSSVGLRIKGVFDSMNRGDFAPLEDIAGKEAAQDHSKRFRSFWRDWQTRYGAYQGTEFLFTTPTGSRMSTYFEVKFENGTQVIRAAQRDGDGPVSLSRVSLSTRSSFPALPIGPGEFSYFDFRSGTNVEIRFPTASGDHHHAAAMELRLLNGEIRAPAVGDR